MSQYKKVMMVGSAEQSGGGVSSVIKLMKKMPVWEKYSCYWLGTQIQRNYLWKLWYAVKAAVIAPFIMWRYDIIHFHTVPDKVGLIIQLPELLLAKLYHKKVIIEVHVGNQLNDHTENGLFKWCLNRADIIALLAKRWVKLFEEKYSPDPTLPSRDSLPPAPSRRGGVTTPTCVIYNACDTREEGKREERFFASKASQSAEREVREEREKTIIMVGDLRINKSCDTLLDAFASIHRKYPDWKIVLLGRGNQEENLKHQTANLGIEDKVIFPGYVTGDTFRNYFSKAGIYCMCSKVEGFPMAVLEAWGYGVPVITTPVGGLPDVMEERKNCISFEHGDSKRLAENISYLIENPEIRKEMSEYSKVFVKENFSLEKISRDIDNIYKKILSNA